jgi:hypothetical protein
LPAVDLPVSHTGLLLYYPPLFHVTAEPGAFRTQAYERPAGALAGASPAPPVTAPAANQQNDFLQQLNRNATQAGSQMLVDRFNARTESRRSNVTLPLRITFPALGPSLFLVSELSSENQPPTVEFAYQKDRKGAAK